MAKTKHGIFRDMKAMNMNDSSSMTGSEQQQMNMDEANKKANKPRKSM